MVATMKIMTESVGGRQDSRRETRRLQLESLLLHGTWREVLELYVYTFQRPPTVGMLLSQDLVERILELEFPTAEKK